MSLEPIDYFGEKLYRWKVGPSTFLAMPELGARLMHWSLDMADGHVRDVIHWPANVQNLDKVASIRGGNPILFPFSGKSFHEKQPGCWNCSGTTCPMPAHGFARAGRFRVNSLNSAGFSATLLPTAADRECYPFDYEFQVHYRFQELSLTVEMILHNQGNTPLPWSAGHHFYFQLPWHAGLGRKHYEVNIPAKKAWRQSADGLLVADKSFANPCSFSDPALSDRLHSSLRDNKVTFGPLGGEERVMVRMGVGNEIPSEDACVVTWTESEASPFYCVEPWMGLPNGFEHKRGVSFVPEGKKGSFAVEVSLV